MRKLITCLGTIVAAQAWAGGDSAGKVAAINQWATATYKDMKQHHGRAPDADIAKLCLQAYDDAMKAGVSPSEKVPEHQEMGMDGKPFTWSGTIEEIKNKYCAGTVATVSKQQDERLAPLKKVLKNDKLQMASQTGTFIIPGGEATNDAKKLAAASVWFEDTTPLGKTCNGGREIHIIHRHQFDGQQKRVKTTDSEYCGVVPASAYK